MKSFINRIALALVIVSLTSVAVVAKTRTKTITFLDTIKVNGTVVKKGMYDLKFDDKTSELSIAKGGKIIARATASMEKRDSKARNFEWKATGSGDDAQLSIVTFAGAEHNVVLNNTAASR